VQLDLQARVGYAGGAADQDRLDRWGGTFGTEVEGPNAFVGLTLGWPVRNDLARGALVQQRAAARTAELQADRSAQVVTVAVMVAWESLQGAGREYRLARSAEEQLNTAAIRERERVRNGDAAINDVISIEERLLSARLARVQAQQRHATTLAQLRLLTGTLAVPGEGDEARFDLAQLSVLPVLPFSP
jgi:outer membrane protein TolC